MNPISAYPSIPPNIQRLELLLQASESSAERTARLQSAIDEVTADGSGTVFVGAGTWRITTLFLRSGLRLHLESGVVLEAETDLSLYPVVQNPTSNKDQSSFHLLYANGCEDITIEGEGIIDGQDTEFWALAETPNQRPFGIFDYYAKGERISPLIQIVGCQRVRVENITIRRAPGWTLHAFNCDEVHFRGIRIRNHLMGPNADGITINGCRNVFVRECDIITGDDAIGIKATNPNIECRGVVVSDCIAETNCGAFILGAETLGGIYDVTFNNCVSRASLRMIAIEMWDAGHVENVIFNNIVGRTFPQRGVTCERPIYMDIQQFFRPEPELGRIRNIICSNIISTTRGRIVLTAQDGAQLENIVLRDIHLEIPEIEDPHEAVSEARSWQNSNFNPETRAARAAVVADNVNGLILSNVSVKWPAENNIPMQAFCLRRVEESEINSPRLKSNQSDLAPQVALY